MSRPLKPGDAVLVIGGHPRAGALTTVIRSHTINQRDDRLTPTAIEQGLRFGALVYDLDLPPSPGAHLCVAEPHELLPLHDPDKTAEYLAELNAPEREGQR